MKLTAQAIGIFLIAMILLAILGGESDKPKKEEPKMTLAEKEKYIRDYCTENYGPERDKPISYAACIRRFYR